MDPTPNEAEMREATEWCYGELASSGVPPMPINAYAAALAKRRVQSVCEVCGGTGAYLTESARSEIAMGHGYSPTPDDYIECDCVIGKVMAERERCAKIALITRIKLIGLDNLNSVALAKKNVQAMREAIAAAIRGGGQ